MAFTRRILRALVTAGTLCSPAFGADVLVVDDSGGADFTDVQAAFDAALDGDTILVKPGHYGAAVASSKGLSLIADSTATIAGGLRFENTLVHHAILVSGFTLRGAKPLGDPIGVPALTLSIVRGPVRIESCDLIGVAPPSSCSWPPDPFGDCAGGPAARVRFGLDVSFARCTIRGGRGMFSLTGGDHNAGGHGLVLEAGNVALHDCTVMGGQGWSSEHHDLLDEGGHGGDAIHGRDTVAVPLFVSITGCALQGGDGGDGDLWLCRAGDGGDALHLTGVGARAEILDSSLGPGGVGCGPNTPMPGVPVRLEAGATSMTFPGSARSLAGPSPLREGAAASLIASGRPGDLIVLLRASAASFVPRPAWSGVLLLGDPSIQSFEILGTLPASGTRTHPFTTRSLAPGVESAVTYHQLLARDIAGGVWLSGPWTPLTLDTAF